MQAVLQSDPNNAPAWSALGAALADQKLHAAADEPFATAKRA